MGTSMVLQELITVSGTASSNPVFEMQPREGFISCMNWKSAVFTLYVVDATHDAGDNINVSIGTTDIARTGFGLVPDGPAWDVNTWGSVNSNEWYKHLATTEQAAVSGSSKPLDGQVGWVLIIEGGSGNAWSITFEIHVEFKDPA